MPKILKRLARQLAAKGVKNSYRMATGLMHKYGMMKRGSNEELTAKGKRRNRMTPAQRAKDRAARRAHKSPGKYQYNPRTNRATLRRRK